MVAELVAANWPQWVHSQRLTLKRGFIPLRDVSYPSPLSHVLFRKMTLCRRKRPPVNETSEIKHAE